MRAALVLAVVLAGYAWVGESDCRERKARAIPKPHKEQRHDHHRIAEN